MPTLKLYTGTEWVEIAKNGRDGRDGKDGQDANELMIYMEVVRSVKENIQEFLTPAEIKKAVIKAGLSISEIQGSEDFIKKNLPTYGASVVHKFMDDETPSGTINGVNQDFTLSKAPVGGSLKVYRGGARQRITEDYTISGKTITFTIPPVVGEVLLCDYRYF